METINTRIRPAARLISTIGEDLIGDAYAAIVELVKNSYDADASKVDITFFYTTIENCNALKIDIEDDGHGMSRDVVLNAWLVPATKDKLNRTTSPKGRLFQGKKGIGRYAAAILGQELVLRTSDTTGQQTEVFINWSLFESEEFLENVEILVNTLPSAQRSGVSLYITATGKKYDQWGRSELRSLTDELRRLKSPFKDYGANDFQINLAFINSPFEEYNNHVFEIEAYPIIDLFDYRISGNISAAGLVNAKYENNAADNLQEEDVSIEIKLDSESYCGPVDFDIRVFDRDPEAIGNLIDKGLIDPISKLAVGKRDAKRMLDQVYGVNLYREGFRIRPYGNGGIDWLNLDKDRIQNPSLKVSNNQIVGFINIKPESISFLEEKSARDGLKETSHYFGLVKELKAVINELQTRRFTYRQQVGKGRQSKNINHTIVNLFNNSSLTDQITRKLNGLNIDEKTTNEITGIIQKDAEIKSKLLEDLQNTIAIYQGQATLGKIVTVLLHEGRKPIQYFKQQSPNLSRWLIHYKSQGKWDNELYDDILDRLKNFKQHSDMLAELFKRLDPLAKQNRGEKKEFFLKDAINKAIRIFENQIKADNISINLICEDKVSIVGWEDDLIIALTNFIENSLYWLSQEHGNEKEISIEVVSNNEDIAIHYKDSGPGIEKTNIESGVIFEPGFSKKLDGTGLGLPIAGESIERLGGSIVAHHTTNGAYFTIELKK